MDLKLRIKLCLITARIWGMFPFVIVSLMITWILLAMAVGSKEATRTLTLGFCGSGEDREEAEFMLGDSKERIKVHPSNQ